MVPCYLSGAHSHSFPSSVLVCVFPVLKKLLWALIERPPVVVREFKVSGGAELFSSFLPSLTYADDGGRIWEEEEEEEEEEERLETSLLPPFGSV